MPLPLHYVRRLTVVSLLVYTNTYGSDMYNDRRGAHKTMIRIRRNNGGKNVRRGSDEPYRHSDFRIAPCAHVSCRSPHCGSEPLISRHPAALCPIVVIVPTMETTVVGSRTLRRGAILCCIRVLLQEKSIARARSG